MNKIFFSTVSPDNPVLIRRVNWRLNNKRLKKGQTVHGSWDLIFLDDNTLQIDLRTQSNLYQNPSWFRSRKWKADPKIIMVRQEMQNIQNNLEKEQN